MDRSRFVGRGYGGGMPEAGVGGAGIGNCLGIGSSGCAAVLGRLQDVCARHAVEVETGVELVAAADPPGAETDLVDQGGAQDDIAATGLEGGFGVVVHMLHGPRGPHVKNPVCGVIGIDYYAGVPMVATHAPGGEITLECAVLNEFARRSAWRLDHADVIDEKLSRIEESEDHLVILGRVVAGSEGAPSQVGDFLPGSILEAGSPGFRRAVVCMWVTQFETGACRIGPPRPASTIGETDLVGDISIGVNEAHPLSLARKSAIPLSGDGEVRILGGQGGGITGYHEELPGGEDGVRGELEGDAVAELPAAQAQVLRALVVELYPLIAGAAQGQAFLRGDQLQSHHDVRAARAGLVDFHRKTVGALVQGRQGGGG